MNVADTLLAQAGKDAAAIVVRATVTGISGNSVLVKRANADAADLTAWPRCEASTWPLSVGDEILCLELGNGLIILDRIIR